MESRPVVEHLKSWLDREDLPSNYYQLLDKPCLSNQRDELLKAVHLVTRFLHPYQHHKNEDSRQRARTLQLMAAKAEHTFSDKDVWQSYEADVLDGLREKFRAQLLKQTLSPSIHDARSWLIEEYDIAPDRLEEVVQFVLTDPPQAAGLDDSTPALALVETAQPQSHSNDDSTSLNLARVPGKLPFVLGSYEVLERLGEGGIGVVYKARHLRLQRLVAIKLLRAERSSDALADVRFRREIQVIGQLQHPNIVSATDAGEVNGAHFLVMELLEGQDLHQLVRARGPLPIYEACGLIRQAAFGLQHAHEQGLIHRDIKPSNLMLTKQGVVKILDLGLARLNPTMDELATTQELGDATVSGVIVGTIDYMAPEQFKDRHKIDGRADLYSLGCTLYFLLTGRAPFRDAGSSLLQRLAAHDSQPIPSVRQIRSDSPPALDQLMLRLLAKLPADRCASAAAVAAELESLTIPVGSSPSIPKFVSPPATNVEASATPTPSRPPPTPPSRDTRGNSEKPPTVTRKGGKPPPIHQQPMTAALPSVAIASKSILSRVSGSDPNLTIPTKARTTPPIVRVPKIPARSKSENSNQVILRVAGIVLLLALIGIVWLLASGPQTDTKKTLQSVPPDSKATETPPNDGAP